MAQRDVLLEIGTEEIPSRFLPPMLETLKNLAREDLTQARVPFKELQTYATPRRLVLFARGVDERQKDQVAVFKGPAWSAAFDLMGNPTRAAEGFAKGRGVSVEELKEMDVDGVRYVSAEVREDGRATEALLPELLPALINKLVFPKNMYWSDPAVRFARPIRWIVALFGSAVVPFQYGDVASGRTSSGHRFLGDKHIAVAETGEFLGKLYDNYVVLDQEKRKQKLLSGIAALERECAGTVELDPELVEENLYLVEYPVPFIGTFDERFLEIPQEVLTTSMKKNQKYFAVRSKDGKLKNIFIGVSNNRAMDMKVIRSGNERVLRARLEDAAFFWVEDRKQPLAEKVERLKSIIYQEKLGSVYDKVMHTQKLALWLCEELEKTDLGKLVERAAFLAKADLVTSMVYEFPELQGVMGREYARLGGEDPRVAVALYEQYLPRAAGDATPSDDVGAILGLAERVHIIVSCHKVGLEPTGSQDPYALRRAARCINELIWARKLDVDIKETVRTSAHANLADMADVDRVFAFLEQRLLVQLKEKGYEHELARLALSVTGERPLQVLRLMEVLNEVKDAPWFRDLVTAAVRVRNILLKAGEVSDAIDSALTVKQAEKTLLDAVVRVEPLVEQALRKRDWKGLTELLSELSPAVTAFFDDVMVMDPDQKIRLNRIALLKRCNVLFEEVGNLGALKL